MSPLWSGEALVEATGGRPLGAVPEAVAGISIDTRTLKRGDAFFAIKGDSLDGHDFATAAVAAGAGVLVVAEGRLSALGRLVTPMIVVPDVLEALVKAGIAARARSRAKIVAVTGSVGKTTTKEALRHVLSASGKVHASDKSFNNHWGVPLTLARLPEDADYAVFEIGMNHAGEIRPLVKMVRPHIALVTLVAPAHLGHFRNLDEIAAAKAEIFEGVEPGGVALINRDDPRWSLLGKAAKAAGVARVLGFGENARAAYRLTRLTLYEDHSVITAEIARKEVVARIGAPGRHMVQNALAVLGVADLVGADLDRAALALGGVEAGSGRGRRHRLAHGGGTFTLIDESYNANPVSMRAALSLLAAQEVGEGGRRIAVLGDMLELGPHSRKLHAALAPMAAAAKVDLLLLGGPEMKALADALPQGMAAEYRQGAAELEPVLIETVRPGDAVMVKSSNGTGFSRLVAALMRAYPARPAEQG